MNKKTSSVYHKITMRKSYNETAKTKLFLHFGKTFLTEKKEVRKKELCLFSFRILVGRDLNSVLLI